MKTNHRSLLLGLVALTTILTGFPNLSRAELMETNAIQKSDSSTTTMGCIVTLLKTLYSDVPDLYFKSNCTRDPATDRYRWAFIYKNNEFSGDSDTSMEFCISDMATELNLNIPIIDISLNHRCQRNENSERDPIYFWKYDLKYDLGK